MQKATERSFASLAVVMRRNLVCVCIHLINEGTREKVQSNSWEFFHIRCKIALDRVELGKNGQVFS